MTLEALVDKYNDWFEYADDPVEKAVVEEVLFDLKEWVRLSGK
jgi:hypothetical protein